MNRPARDMESSMSLHQQRIGARPDPARAGGTHLTPEEFSARLEASARSLWLIAAAVLGERSDADDALQEAAMIGLRKVAEFDPATNFGAWMGGIVRNVSRNIA